MAKKTRILVADDEPTNLDFFDVMLSKLGFDVVRAVDGDEALDKIVQSTPDLILLDAVMPGISGWTVIRRLKNDDEYAKYRSIPIIMFSAMDDVQDKIEGYELGVEDYILKPYNFSEVLARIRAVLRSRELARQLVQKERKITLVESLNQSLVYFTRHLNEPVTDLLTRAQQLDTSNREEVEGFRQQVIKELEGGVAALRGLEEEISELEEEHGEFLGSGIDLEDLEEKFRKHFAVVRRQVNANEVHR